MTKSKDSNEYKMFGDDLDDRPIVKTLFDNLRRELPDLEELLKRCGDDGIYDNLIYRFYHQSFKVYGLQTFTLKIVEKLKTLLPDVPLNDRFMQIVQEGTGKEFAGEDNENWLTVTRPILEAFFHARYFLEMAVKFGRDLEYPPKYGMPFGWAAFLYLYNLR